MLLECSLIVLLAYLILLSTVKSVIDLPHIKFKFEKGLRLLILNYLSGLAVMPEGMP